MAVLCGYLLTSQGSHVNHENHDPKDNRPENLTLWPSNRAHKALRVGEDGGGRLLPSTGVTADVVDYAGWCGASPSRTARSSPDAMG